jgi:cell division protein FtsQ
MLHDPRFVLATTDDIQIEGAKHLTRDQALDVFGADLERNVFRVPLGERRADLERLPWVEHATVMRLLPNVLRVSIKERTPVAFVRQGTQIGLVDANGVLLDMPSGAAGDSHYSFPVLTGLSAQQTWQARAERMQVYSRFMAAMSGAGGHLTDSLSEVDVTDPEDVKALIASGSSDVMVHFGNEEFVKRYQEFEEHLPEWRQLYPKLASADMRYEGQVVLEMQGGGGSGAVNTSTSNAGSSAIPAARSGTGSATGRDARADTAHVSSEKMPLDTRHGENGGISGAAAKPAVAKPALKAPVARRTVAKKRSERGRSAANERVFAALAAAHKAALEKKAAASTSR